MTHPLDPHEPAPEFMAHMEWQIQTAIRRETRLASPATGVRRLRGAVIVAAAIMIGAAGGVASGEMQDARVRELLIQSRQAEETLLRMRYELAKAEYETARRQFEVGTAGAETMAAAEDRYRTMTAAMKRLQVDVEEIKATSMAPDNNLDAPLVGKRDFVRERLMLDAEAAQLALVAAEASLAATRRMVGVGLAPEGTRLRAEAEVAEAQRQMRRLQAELELRQRFLRGELKPAAIAASQRVTELTLAQERAHLEIRLARDLLDRVRKRVELGLAAQLEVKRAEIAVLERELELQRIRTELDALKRAR